MLPLNSEPHDIDDGAGVPAGLCESCMHARPIKSSKGTSFVLCHLSYTDSRFPRYPRLPVLACDGYQPAGPNR